MPVQSEQLFMAPAAQAPAVQPTLTIILALGSSRYCRTPTNTVSLRLDS